MFEGVSFHPGDPSGRAGLGPDSSPSDGGPHVAVFVRQEPVFEVSAFGLVLEVVEEVPVDGDVPVVAGLRFVGVAEVVDVDEGVDFVDLEVAPL